MEKYAASLRSAGVDVQFAIQSGQLRGFFSNLAVYGSELGFQQVVRAVRRRLSKIELDARQESGTHA